MDLFDHYPHAPGFKEHDTARAAAESMKGTVVHLREICLARLAHAPSTPDEIADWCGASVLAIRPRMSELHKQGLIVDTGMRRSNASGRSAKVWRRT